MRLSIIIPTLNEASVIRRSLTHAWQMCPHEVVVIDGGSVDETRSIANETASKCIVTAAGRGIQLHAGAKAATGDVLLFLHADSWLEAVAAKQINDVLSDAKVAWGAFRQCIDAEGRLYRLLESGNALRARRLQLPYGDQAIFVRRSVYEQVGGFANLPLMEDVDLSKRLQAIGHPALLNGPLHLSARRWQQNGIVRQTIRNWALLVAWRVGVSPERLVQWYRPHFSSRDSRDSQHADRSV